MSDEDSDDDSDQFSLLEPWLINNADGSTAAIPAEPRPGYPVLFPITHALSCGEITRGELDGRHITCLAFAGELVRNGGGEEGDEAEMGGGTVEERVIGPGANYFMLTLDQLERLGRDIGTYVVAHRAAGYR